MWSIRNPSQANAGMDSLVWIFEFQAWMNFRECLFSGNVSSRARDWHCFDMHFSIWKIWWGTKQVLSRM